MPCWNERFPSFQTCRCVCVFSSVGRMLDRLSNGSLPWLEAVVSPFLQLCASVFSSHRRTSTCEVSLSIRSHVACVVKHRIINKQKRVRGSSRAIEQLTVSGFSLWARQTSRSTLRLRPQLSWIDIQTQKGKSVALLTPRRRHNQVETGAVKSRKCRACENQPHQRRDERGLHLSTGTHTSK